MLDLEAKAIEPGLRRSFMAAQYYGYSLLGAGKTVAYSRHCDALLRAFADTEVASSGGHVAWLCVLVEDEQLDSEAVVRLAQVDVNVNAQDGVWEARLKLGAALYRTLQYQAAADMLTEVADQVMSQASPSQHGQLACSQIFWRWRVNAWGTTTKHARFSRTRQH